MSTTFEKNNAIPSASGRPDCWSCQHFAVSWDPKLPYACRQMGFKSRALPCLEVIGADGRPCMGYVRKARLGVAPAR
jgi:hypothetical protein